MKATDKSRRTPVSTFKTIVVERDEKAILALRLTAAPQGGFFFSKHGKRSTCCEEFIRVSQDFLG